MNYIEKISTVANSLLANAINGWFEGLPLEEVALMNRITQKFQFDAQECNLGFGKSAIVDSSLEQLHRRGKNGIDKYGSDLAITVLINNRSFCKTAFLQFKVGTSDSFYVNNKQLLRAFREDKVRDNFHLFYMNKSNGKTSMLDFDTNKWFMCFMKDLADEEGSITFNTSNFWNFYIWIYLWLHCEIHENSFDNDFKIEKSLFRETEIEFDFPVPWLYESKDIERMSEIPPTANWLVLNVETSE